MTTEDQIRSAIFEALGKIAPETDARSLSPDDDLRQSLDIDSFDFLNFLVAIDEKLGVDIPEQDYGKLRTLRSLVDYLSARTSK